MSADPFSLIMGIDPGSNHTGYGFVAVKNGLLELVAQGRFSPPKTWDLPRRLAYIHKGLYELALHYSPGAVAVEDIFFGSNVRSALKLGQARGVALLAAAQIGAPVFEYAPRLIKNAVVGYGQASKEQVAHIIGELLNFHETMTADAADALAAAVCHAGQSRFSRVLKAAGGTRSRGWRGLTAEDLNALNYGGSK